jgi:predicted nucleic acid-binding protein
VIAYFDTSALLKLMLAEEGSDLARRLWDAVDGRSASAAAYPEARAALAAAARSRRLGASGHRNAKRELDRRMRQIELVALAEPLARAAGDVAEHFRLRGYDAVHLASALSMTADALTFITWDEALGAAASEAGLAVAPA